jgi:glucan phosphorylase
MLDKKIQANTATTPEIDTYNTATKLHKIVEKNMHKAFEKAGRTDLSPSLAEANKHYVENVLTHRNPLINKYKRGELTESDLISGLLKNKTARKQLFPQYPELGVRKSLPYVAGGIGIPAASYLGLPSAIGYLSGNK